MNIHECKFLSCNNRQVRSWPKCSKLLEAVCDMVRVVTARRHHWTSSLWKCTEGYRCKRRNAQVITSAEPFWETYITMHLYRDGGHVQKEPKQEVIRFGRLHGTIFRLILQFLLTAPLEPNEVSIGLGFILIAVFI